MEENNFETQIKKKENKKSFWRETFEIIIFTAIIVIPIQMFIGRTFIVVGLSMYPTFNNSDYLVVDKLTYQFNEPKRGDVIVFHPPTNIKTYFIKRIIGLPGETIYVEHDKVTIVNKDHPEGFEINMPIDLSKGEIDKALELGKDEYFVMGDNRAESFDSRTWGALPRKNISGRVFLRLLPIKNIGVWPGEFDF